MVEPFCRRRNGRGHAGADPYRADRDCGSARMAKRTAGPVSTLASQALFVCTDCPVYLSLQPSHLPAALSPRSSDISFSAKFGLADNQKAGCGARLWRRFDRGGGRGVDSAGITIQIALIPGCRYSVASPWQARPHAVIAWCSVMPPRIVNFSGCNGSNDD